MANLYELTQSYNNLLDLVDNPEIPSKILKKNLDNIEENLETKAENTAKVIKAIEVDIKGLKEEERRLSNKRKCLEKRIVNLKDYIKESMDSTGKRKIKGKVFTLGIQKNAPSVEITEEKSIPKEYFIVEKKLVKKDILVALKEGREVPGAAMKQTESLRIR